MKYIFALILICFASNIAYSQFDFGIEEEVQEDPRPAFGPWITFSTAVNSNINPEGRKAGLGVSSIPNFGFWLQLPADIYANAEFCANISYSNYSFVIKDARPETAKSYEYKTSYINIGPRILFNNFILGFDLGLPISSKMDGNNFNTENINMLADIKFGYKHNIYRDETAQVNIFGELGYMLNGIFSDFAKDDPMHSVKVDPDQKITNSFNPRAASIQIGFNYLFDIEALSQVEQETKTE